MSIETSVMFGAQSTAAERLSGAPFYISSGSPYCRDAGGVWLPPIEWKSLKPWWELLEEVTILKPEIVGARPAGWLRVPSSIRVRRLCASDGGRVARRRETLRSARKIMVPRGTLMVRMPYYESAWCWQVAREIGLRHFVEIHGDWETAVLEEDVHTLFRRLTRRARARSNRRVVEKISASAIFALGVGPKLVEKFVPRSVPSLVSTNHLIEAANYSPRTQPTGNYPPRILFVGELQRRKGLHVLFEALGQLHEAGNQFRMVLVGSGPAEVELLTSARQWGFADKVSFVGNVPHGEQLYRYFKESDVFVLPSVAAEGVPRVTHEALALGCPVIATDIGSVAWQLEGGAGIVVPAGNSQVLAEIIRKVLSDGALRQQLSEHGYKRSLMYTFEQQNQRTAHFVRKHL